ncbi:MAG: arginine repressor [Clostridium sp.]|uniref:arginine repressor n=1 Tax=Clostridium sp. TaxID=1506 RepID=UPI002907604E|nr:arginine repressor [Clostridium sp.]MDU7337186.1 arginine repressor [Clostridium sp.]
MKTRRHTKILELISEYQVDTQEELLRRLKDAGFDVTQATVSRDIKELRLVKILSADGKYRYANNQEPSRDISGIFYSLFEDSAIEVDNAMNLVVIKCLTGMANAVCAALDGLRWEKVVGTVAGDDTVLVITKTPETALELKEDLKKLISGR